MSGNTASSERYQNPRRLRAISRFLAANGVKRRINAALKRSALREEVGFCPDKAVAVPLFSGMISQFKVRLRT